MDRPSQTSLQTTTPHALHVGVSPLHPGLCRMLEDKCVSYYDHLTDEKSEVQNRQLPCPRSPDQQAPDLPFTCKVSSSSTPGRGREETPQEREAVGMKGNEGGLRLPWPFWLPAMAIPHPPCAHPGPAPPSCCLAGKSNSPCGQTLLLGPPQRFQIMKEP